MAKRKSLDRKISALTQRFVEHLRTRGIPIEAAIVFGSWAKGRARKGSDVDICLVSPKFGRDEITELQFLLKESRQVDDRIEPIGLSLADFNENATPLVLEVKKYGRQIKV